MFVATVINFLLLGLSTGGQVYALLVFIRKPLIQDVNYPLTEARIENLVNNTLRGVHLFGFWVGVLGVSIKLSLSNLVSIDPLGGDIPQRSHCDLEGLGPLPRSAAGCPHTIRYVDWNRG